MKREIKRIYRRCMRTIARFILGFENCPKDYKKNFVERIGNGVLYLIGGFAVVFAFLTIALALSC